MSIFSGKPFLILSLLFCAFSCSEEMKYQNTLFVNMKGAIGRIDPAFASNQATTRLCTNLFQTLVSIDSQSNIQYSLAESITFSDSNTIVTIQLKQASFSDGSPITAYDVQYSLERLNATELASPGSWVFENRIRPKGIVANDSFQLTLYLTKPFSPFLQLLSLPYCGIIKAYSDLENEVPIGSGDYILSERNADYLILALNPFATHLEGQIEQIVISNIEDGATEFLAFLDHKVDIILDLDFSVQPLLFQEGKTIQPQFQDKIELLTSPFLNVEYIGFNLEAPNCPEILKQKAFRKALALAIPKQEFVETILGNKGIAATAGMTPPLFEGFEDCQYGTTYSLNQAKSIIDSLAKEGIIQQSPIQLSLAPNYSVWGESIQKSWEEIGVKCQLQIENNSMIRSAMRSGDIHCFRASWIADYPSAENYASLFYGRNSAPPNYTRYLNKQVDLLYEEALTTEENAHLYRAIDSIVMQDFQVIPIVYDEAWRFISPSISGAKPDLQNTLVFNRIRKK